MKYLIHIEMKSGASHEYIIESDSQSMAEVEALDQFYIDFPVDDVQSFWSMITK